MDKNPRRNSRLGRGAHGFPPFQLPIFKKTPEALVREAEHFFQSPEWNTFLSESEDCDTERLRNTLSPKDIRPYAEVVTTAYQNHKAIHYNDAARQIYKDRHTAWKEAYKRAKAHKRGVDKDLAELRATSERNPRSPVSLQSQRFIEQILDIQRKVEAYVRFVEAHRPRFRYAPTNSEKRAELWRSELGTTFVVPPERGLGLSDERLIFKLWLQMVGPDNREHEHVMFALALAWAVAPTPDSKKREDGSSVEWPLFASFQRKLDHVRKIIRKQQNSSPTARS